MSTFFLIANSVWIAINFYITLRIRKIIPPPFGVALGGLFALSAPLAFYLARGEFDWPATAQYALFLIAGQTMTLFPILLALDIALLSARLIALIVNRARAERADSGASSRSGIERASLPLLRAALFVSIALTTIGASQAAHSPPQIRTHEIYFPDLPKALDRLRVVHISDLHISAHKSRAAIARIVDEVNSLDPDMLAVTGDIADGFVDRLAPQLAELDRLKARHGVFFVTGNHEYYWNRFEWLDRIARAGFAILSNEARVIEIADAKLAIAGVNDYQASQSDRATRFDMKKALKLAEGADFTIALTHRPDGFEDAIEGRADLLLVGHTHNGQFFPWTLIVPHLHPLKTGLSRLGATTINLTSGASSWGPPLRTFNPAEIVLLILRSPDRSAEST